MQRSFPSSLSQSERLHLLSIFFQNGGPVPCDQIVLNFLRSYQYWSTSNLKFSSQQIQNWYIPSWSEQKNSYTWKGVSSSRNDCFEIYVKFLFVQSLRKSSETSFLRFSISNNSETTGLISYTEDLIENFFLGEDLSVKIGWVPCLHHNHEKPENPKKLLIICLLEKRIYVSR